MRITVTRSGGYAGLSEPIADVDSAALPESKRTRLASEIAACKFFTLPETVGGSVGADMFRYEITIEDGGRRHTVAFTDDNTPATAGLKRLVESLQN